MRKIFIFLFFVIFFYKSSDSFSQIINVKPIKIDSVQTSDKSNIIYDINNEICSIVLINSPLDNLKFYSNLGIEKVIKYYDGNHGYKIFIPYQTTIFKILIPGSPLIEYKLPPSDYKYSIFVIILEIEENEQIVFIDTTKPSLSFEVVPYSSKIFINGKFMGRSPLIINNPEFNSFEYSIKKRGFGPSVSKDSMDEKIKNINIKLRDLRNDKRIFFSVYILKSGGVSLATSRRVDSSGESIGFTTGIFGKTGVYVSSNYRNTEVVPVTPIEGEDKYSNYFRYFKSNRLSIAAGITKQLGKSMFIYGGPGFTKQSYYEINNNKPEEYSLVDLNMGIIFRICWYSIFQIDYSRSLNGPFNSFGLGLGFNFSKPLK